MKRQLAFLALIIAAAALSGCYYDPGYSYVRSSGYAGDAYYGSASNTYYAAPSYYDGYSPAYYGGSYGCCYAPGVSIGISGLWYGGSQHRGYRNYRHSRPQGSHGRGHYRGDRSGWSGQRGSSRRGSSHRGSSHPGSSHRGGRPSNGHGHRRR